MNTNKLFTMFAMALAVVLVSALCSTPAVAGDIGQDKRIRAYEPEATIGPFDPVNPFGPAEQRIRADDGKPASKVPGVNSGPIKDVVTKSGKFGTVNWRITLVHPFWTPVLDFISGKDDRE